MMRTSTSQQLRPFSSSGGGGNNIDNDDDSNIPELNERDAALRFQIVTKLGIGSRKWSQLMTPAALAPAATTTTTSTATTGPEPSSKGSSTTFAPYLEVMETALINGINTLEIGQENGGDLVMSSIISKTNSVNGAHLLKRVGYRTVVISNNNNNSDDDNDDAGGGGEGTKAELGTIDQELKNRIVPPSSRTRIPGDVTVEQLAATNNVNNGNNNSNSNTTAMVVHNISRPAIRAALQESPLCMPDFIAENPDVHMTILLHNPEVQGHAPPQQPSFASASSASTTDDSLLTPEHRNARVCDRLTEAFLAVEHEIAEQQYSTMVQSYGIVSNGLGLPPDHPLHLSWSHAMAPALQQVQDELQRPLKFEIVQLPLNLFETGSLQAAYQIKRDRPQTQIYAMRPLTAYPNGGTGSAGFPIHFCDHELPPAMDGAMSSMKWTHEMSSPPTVYQIALQTTMQYFDAEDILQSQVRGKQLTTEERETLDGCKLLQSLLHDLDNELDSAKSLEEHEHQLMTKIIPLIYDTFEGYDDDTAEVLEKYFQAYGIAIRYHIAQNTRKLLIQGNSNNNHGSDFLNAPTYPDLSPDLRLQDQALRFVLSHSNVIDKIIVGCTEMDHVIQDMEILHQYLLSQEQEQQQQHKP